MIPFVASSTPYCKYVVLPVSNNIQHCPSFGIYLTSPSGLVSLHVRTLAVS